MQCSEHQITLNNKSARYYQLIADSDAKQDTKQMATQITTQNTDKPAVKPTVHFYGGNGFAVGVYQPFLSCLARDFNVISLAMRGCWHDKPTADKLHREEDADMLIEFLQATQSQPVIGIGHSQGATATAIAATKRPDLFQSLYLIEPVTFTKFQFILYECLPSFIKQRYEPFKGTLRKQTHWESVDDYYQYLRQHKAYKRVSDENLQIYAQHSLQKNEADGFELIFLPEQELANYHGKTPFIDPSLKQLNQLGLPYHLIIGKPNLFISDKVRKEWAKFVDKDKIITFSVKQ